MVDKFLAQIDAKLDAIIEKLGIKQEEIRAKLHEREPFGRAPTQEMSEADKQAVANAPATPAAQPKVPPPTEGEAAPVTPAPDEPEAPAVPRNRR